MACFFGFPSSVMTASLNDPFHVSAPAPGSSCQMMINFDNFEAGGYSDPCFPKKKLGRWFGGGCFKKQLLGVLTMFS